MNEQISRDQFAFKYGGNQVKGIENVSFSIDNNVIEANNFDVGQITRAIKGRSTVTCSVDFQVDRTDADGQNTIRADAHDSSKQTPEDHDDWAIEAPTTASGDTTFGGACIITNYSEDGGDDGDGLITGSFEIRITSITESTAT